jgi:hypothetical protein
MDDLEKYLASRATREETSIVLVGKVIVPTTYTVCDQ